MALSDRLREAVLAVMGVSEYQSVTPPNYGVDIDDPAVHRNRRALGGQIQPLPTTQLRWYLKDLETAQASADAGFLYLASRLYRAMRRDGTIAGLLGSRTAGLIRLPKRFYGNPQVCSDLRSRNTTRSVFDEMIPPAEAAMMIADGITLGISVGELVPVHGRSYPVLVRLEPEFLQYRWNENRWYFNSLSGALPITPGDGRWVLHIPGGRLTPWVSGLWPALGRAFINKEHAINHRSNYSAKLANPARVAVSPSGATEDQRQGFFKQLLRWGVNTVFSLPVGWDVKLIESNGQGFQVFQKEIDTCDQELMIAIAGQMVTTTGGTGFANAEVPEAIRHDLIQSDGDNWAYTVNTQILPQFAVTHFGQAGLDEPALVEWDTSTPADRVKEAQIISQVAASLGTLTDAFAAHGLAISAQELAVRFAIPVHEGVAPTADPQGERASIVPGDTEKTPSPESPKGSQD